jgi:signal transduction histidine kinase
VVPSVGLVGAMLIAGQLLRANLEEGLDRALLTQAAVESVSLFDGPDQKPHLHMAKSPLEEQVRPFVPSGALFGPDNRLVVRHPDVEGVQIEPPPNERPPPGTPQLETHVLEGGHRARELTVGVRAPSGELYTLRLVASLGQIDASIGTFHRVMGTVAVALASVLVLVQLAQGRRLSRRLRGLQEHVTALHQGRLDQNAPIPADGTNDEISELQAVLETARQKLRLGRENQERLIADAAHELRTPLTLMRTSMDLALRRERSTTELREVVSDARSEVDRLAALASRLLDLAALGRGTWTRVPGDLRSVVEAAIDAARPAAEAHSLRIDLEAPAQVTAAIDAAALRQAVDNLLSNALRFSPPGGRILLRVERHHDAWRIIVGDEGRGIPQEEREAVFAPFHRLARSGTGAGLGLSIVREVAELHAGRAYVLDDEAPGARIALEVGDRV